MSTLTIPADRWLTDLRPGDQIVTLDGYDLGIVRAVEAADVVTEAGPHAVRLVNHLGTATQHHLYPSDHEAVTIERAEPFSLSRRERNALNRNPRYVRLLRSLAEGPRRAEDRGEGVTLAAMGVDHVWGYDWTERGPRRTWQITERGRRVLAAYDRQARV